MPCGDMMDHDQVKRYIDEDVIEVVPLAYMRGRTLNDAFVILDEAQNTTVAQMKMFLTRMGEGLARWSCPVIRRRSICRRTRRAA